MATTSAARAAPQSPVREAGRHDRLFYGGMAVAMGLTVFAGFASTYYLRFLTGGPKATLTGGPFTTLVYVHGALFTAWVLLFIVQTALVAGRRVAVHRRLGVAGAVLAAAMIVAGTFIAIATAKRGAAPVGVDPLAFLVIPLFDMILFATFVTAALALRRDKEAHKRLMLLAYISIIVAAVARLPGVLRGGPPGVLRPDAPLCRGGRDLRLPLEASGAQSLSVGWSAHRGLHTAASGYLEDRRLANAGGAVDEVRPRAPLMSFSVGWRRA